MRHAEFTTETRSAEESKIAAKWLGRIAACLPEDEQPVFDQALATTGISRQDMIAVHNLRAHHLDKVLTLVHKEVPEISLQMLAHTEILDLGLMGYAAINSGTVGKALEILLRYHSLTSQRYYDVLEVEGDTAVIMPVPRTGFMGDLQQIAEESVAGNWHSLELMLGPQVVDYGDASAHFYFDQPAYVDVFHDVIHCPCHFGAERSELRFPSSWLMLPIAAADQAIADVCTAMCERLLGPGDNRHDTRQMVTRLLLSRPGRRMFRLDEAAEELRLSTTQLRKRLYRAGTSYKQIVLEIRMELARHYLEDSHLSIQEIAYLLDYTQPGPFSRAFKSFFNTSPAQYREAFLEDKLPKQRPV